MLRARDAMDRAYAQPLDVAALAWIAHVSQAHFTRTFRATFGETPHRYLQRRRVERAMFLLRETEGSVTDIWLLGRGVEFTEEPTERPYGIDCGLRDPFGNSIRFTEPKS
jgi:methylphosphotriester-DNA--protein-cysteine methyltransferase